MLVYEIMLPPSKVMVPSSEAGKMRRSSASGLHPIKNLDPPLHVTPYTLSCIETVKF